MLNRVNVCELTSFLEMFKSFSNEIPAGEV